MAEQYKTTGSLAVMEKQRVIVIEAADRPQNIRVRVGKPQAEAASTTWVGRCRHLICPVMMAVMTVGLYRFPTSFWMTSLRRRAKRSPGILL